MSEFLHLSRSALVAELVAPIGAVSDAMIAYRLADEAPPSDALIARRLAIAREVLIRDLEQEFAGTTVLGSSAKVREYLTLCYAHLPHEVFGVLFLDAQNRLIEAQLEMFRGTLCEASVYPREVVKAALACNAAKVILCHCHPSGTPEPSKTDELLTTRLEQALALVDVKVVVDHLIVAGAITPVSFAERGLL